MLALRAWNKAADVNNANELTGSPDYDALKELCALVRALSICLDKAEPESMRLYLMAQYADIDATY